MGAGVAEPPALTRGPADRGGGGLLVGPVPSRSAVPPPTLAAVWFAVAILGFLALLAIADYRRDPEDWKRDRILYVTTGAAVVIVTIVAAVIPWGS